MPELAPAGPVADIDPRFMEAAIRLGRRELGRTWPNPAVGALIVAPDGVIVGRGWTRAGGRPHAEREALADAGPLARGATAYVSLEPCSHHGGSPPCVDALIASGVARVVTALVDPNPLVAGTGHAALEAAGITVVTGIGAAAARLAHCGHIMRVSAGRPWVTLKLAISRDGAIAGPGRTPVAITGPQARAQAHMLRAVHDAILIGSSTALADDPELTCRLPGLFDRSPVRVVLDRRLRLDVASRLVATIDAAPLWIITGAAVDPARRRALEFAGARVFAAQSNDNRFAIEEALTRLGEAGITRVLVEGGAEIAGALIAADLVDEAVLFEADREMGEGGLAAIAGDGLAVVTGSGAYRRLDERPMGEDRMTTYLRAR